MLGVSARPLSVLVRNVTDGSNQISLIYRAAEVILMKFRLLVPVTIVIFLLSSVVAAQTGRKIAFGASEYFDPFGILGSPVGSYLLAGSVYCPGNEPTGDPLQPCPEGSRTNSRGVRWVSRVISSTPGISDGWMTVDSSANLSPDFTGPQWGTFSLQYDSGETLDGTWQGVRWRDGDQWVGTLHATGRITGGQYDGAQVVIEDRIVSFTPIPIAYLGTIEGRIINP